MSEQLVIGKGQIGTAIMQTLNLPGYDITDEAMPEQSFDVLHVAIPHTPDFVHYVKGYEKIFEAKLVIVYSTVPIGTCESEGWVHSPVEGKHPDLAESMGLFCRWVGSSDAAKRKAACLIWSPYARFAVPVPSADYTEYLKLRSTARYGINLVFADYEAQVADEIDMPRSLLKWYDQDYNELYEDLGVDWAKRYVLDSPDGVIGGHCVVPNAEILNEQYPNKMLEKIIEMRG